MINGNGLFILLICWLIYDNIINYKTIFEDCKTLKNNTSSKDGVTILAMTELKKDVESRMFFNFLYSSFMLYLLIRLFG